MSEVKLSAGIPVPEKYELREVKPTAVTPVLDGVITEAEWGDTPDFTVTHKLGEKRTFCRDTFGGDRNIPAVEYFWRYDDAHLYGALRITEKTEYVTPAPVKADHLSRKLSVHFGRAFGIVMLEGDTVTSTCGNAHFAYAVRDGVRSFEFAVSRDAACGGENGCIGFVEYGIDVYYQGESGMMESRDVCVRTTPVNADTAFTHDVFVLAEGTPAPAPVIEFAPPRTPATDEWDVEVKEGLTLRFGKPAVIEQGDVGDQIWGHYQFPAIRRMTDGSLRISWSYGRDTIEYKHDVTPRATYAVSRDEGKTWERGGACSGSGAANLMPNGKYFAGFRGKGAYRADYMAKYEPAMTWGQYKMYFAEDIAETVDTAVSAYEYDPATGKTEEFACRINWPHMPIVQFPGGLLYPVTQVFALCAGAVTTVDGVLYLPAYGYGFDAFAPDREAAKFENARYFSVFFFKSADCGRTWELLSQIKAGGPVTDYSEGPCEPEMTVAPDGSFVMLFRTGSNNPCYVVRSTDRGVTWSTPRRLDDIGVLPQILSLPCGVTLATFGRPKMRFTAADDPAAMDWAVPQTFPLSAPAGMNAFQVSCFYTDLFPVSDDTALFAYTDFMYPNEYGAPAKTVLVRTVTVIKD